MKSRTSFFNAAVFKRDLRRGAPLWGLYLLIWLVSMPMALVSQTWRDAMQTERLVLEAAQISSHIIPFFYGAAVAFLLFSWLYRSRSANFFGALPLKREQMFATKYLTGLVFLLLPHTVTALATVLAGAARNVNLVPAVLSWFAASGVAYIFYFSFAVFCAMVVGHLVAAPLLYGVLNFAAVVLEAVVRNLLSAFVYGMGVGSELILDWLSPMCYFCMEGCGLRVRSELDAAQNVCGWHLEGWTPLLILGAVGVAFALLAFWMYRKRRMESAGDVIAVRHLKPFFLYGFTLGCSLVIGWGLAAIMVDGADTGNFLPVLLCLLAGAVIGYFSGQMMLHKSLRVFRKRNWANCAVACAVIAAALCCCRFDLFGYSRYVPASADVAAVSLTYGSDDFSQDPALIAQTVELHQAIVDRQSETEQELRNTWGVTMYLTYKMQDGSTVNRRYELPVTAALSRDPDSLIRRYEDIYNDPDYIVIRELPAYTRESVESACLYNYRLDEEYYFNSRDTYDLLKNGVEPDLRETDLRVFRWSYEETLKDVPDTEIMEPDQVMDCYLEIYFRNSSGDRASETYYLDMTAEAVHTIQALMDLGVPEEVLSPS